MDKIVDDLIKRYNLSPPINTIHLAEVLGYTIEWFKWPKENYDGILGFADVGDNLIYVNNRVSTEDKLYTVAHELGQILLHPDLVKSKDYKVLTKDNRNEKAYAFANALQMPISFLKRYAKVAYEYSELARVFVVDETRIISYMSSL